MFQPTAHLFVTTAIPTDAQRQVVAVDDLQLLFRALLLEGINGQAVSTKREQQGMHVLRIADKIVQPGLIIRKFPLQVFQTGIPGGSQAVQGWQQVTAAAVPVQGSMVEPYKVFIHKQAAEKRVVSLLVRVQGAAA